MVTAAALKRAAKSNTSLPAISLDFLLAFTLLCTQAVLVAMLIAAPPRQPFLVAIRACMVLAQATMPAGSSNLLGLGSR
jgi:hypothetical protein